MLCNRSRTVVKRADPVMGYAGYVVYDGYAGYVEYVGYAPLMNWHFLAGRRRAVVDDSSTVYDVDALRLD